MFSRRWFLTMLPMWPVVAAGSEQDPDAPPLERLAGAWNSRTMETMTARYRADATVMLLGMSLVSRSGVGSGTVTIDRGRAVEDVQTVALRFMAGSTPEKARGLNRLGYIQEYVVERGPNILESAYFGLITSSKEEGSDRARAGARPLAKDALLYTAVEGSVTPRASAYRMYEMRIPSVFDYNRCDEVIRHVKDTLARRQIPPARQESTPSETARTFLYAVREAMRSTQAKTSVPFLFNGKQYRLDMIRSGDIKTGQELQSRKAARAATSVYRLSGTIQNLATGDKTPFRLWGEEGREVPLRFEYRGRAYLNLSFELVPS